MPIYDYRCSGCSHRFELRQSFSDDSMTNCPECGEASQRVMHPVGIVFKGSGWHSTDYRSASRSGGTDKGESSSDGKSEVKSDSKNGSKSETKKESEAPAASATSGASASSPPTSD